jgi:hypothetical protein
MFVNTSLRYLLDESCHIEDLALTFSVSEFCGDNQYVEVALIQGGGEISVTDANKFDYVDRMVIYTYMLYLYITSMS